MVNRGTFAGDITEQTWQVFSPGSQPFLVYSAASGTPVQPLLGSATILASYRYDRPLGRINYQGYIQFASDTDFGSGDDVWNVLLPVRMREYDSGDVPIGVGYVWQGSAGNRNAPLRVTQSDPKYPIGSAAGTAYDEDHYMQFYLQQNIASGSATFGSGSSTATVSHGLGFTPAASDITINWTGQPTTQQGWYWITGITSSQFTLNIRNSSTGTMAPFSWKIAGIPTGTTTADNLVNQTRPFGQWASGWVLGWNVEYESRR